MMPFLPLEDAPLRWVIMVTRMWAMSAQRILLVAFYASVSLVATGSVESHNVSELEIVAAKEKANFL